MRNVSVLILSVGWLAAAAADAADADMKPFLELSVRRRWFPYNCNSYKYFNLNSNVMNESMNFAWRTNVCKTMDGLVERRRSEK